ncbi:MAG: glycine zipper 2TM domain-containing protein [Pseudomonadota bacterium]
MIRKLILVAALAAGSTVPAAAQTAQESRRFEEAQRRFDSETQNYRAEVDRYVAASRRGGGYRDQGYYDPRANDPRYNSSSYRDPQDEVYYDPSRDYRAGTQYQERVLTQDDRIYRGSDNRYYCRRSDGTVGLIAGGAIGGVLGNIIDGGRSRTLGTLLGAGAGALAGRSIEQNSVRCR